MDVGTVFNPWKMFVGSFVPNALMRWREISATSKLLYARLAQYAGREGHCYPGQDVLAADLGTSPSTITESLRQLVAVKLIRRDTPSGVDRLQHKTTRYVFLWHPALTGEYDSTRKDAAASLHRIPGTRNTGNRVPGAPDSGYPVERDSVQENQHQKTTAKLSPAGGQPPAPAHGQSQSHGHGGKEMGMRGAAGSLESFIERMIELVKADYFHKAGRELAWNGGYRRLFVDLSGGIGAFKTLACWRVWLKGGRAWSNYAGSVAWAPYPFRAYIETLMAAKDLSTFEAAVERDLNLSPDEFLSLVERPRPAA